MENDKNKKFNYTAALARKEVSLCKELYKMAKDRHPQPGYLLLILDQAWIAAMRGFVCADQKIVKDEFIKESEIFFKAGSTMSKKCFGQVQETWRDRKDVDVYCKNLFKGTPAEENRKNQKHELGTDEYQLKMGRTEYVKNKKYKN